MTSFSERMGITQPKKIQINELDTELRNSLWNICRAHWFDRGKRFGEFRFDPVYKVATCLYISYYKQPVDDIPSTYDAFVKQQLNVFKNYKWYHILDMVEFFHALLPHGSLEQQNFEREINGVLEREKSAYRFIVGKLAPITNEIEMQELAQAARHGDRFGPVAEHVKTALGLYSKKPTADYRNSIKESISAVEAAAKIVTGLPKATLGDAIKVIDQRHSLHESFKLGISKLYGYTSDKGGIRHSLMEDTNIDEADARYMLVSCSAFANYLISRYDQQS